jgi:hypothetical protein
MTGEHVDQIAAPGIDTALALSRRAHEAVEAVGIPDLVERWQAVIGSGELSERVAARLVAVGAVFPSDGLVWAATHHPQLMTSADISTRLVVDDPDLASHGLALSGSFAELLGRSPDILVETAELVMGLLDPSSAMG